MPLAEENRFQSRLTSRTSSGLVTDQNPSSSGESLISPQWTGHPRRSRLKSSCGGPSAQLSRSATAIWSSACSCLVAILAPPVALGARLLAGEPGSKRARPTDRSAGREAERQQREGRHHADVG